ncbi:MAG TPA: hypothetical protein VIW24_05640 [Aldersonia sp.]
MPVGEPPHQTGRRGRGQARHRYQRLTGRGGASAIQPDREIRLSGQLRRREPTSSSPAPNRLLRCLIGPRDPWLVENLPQTYMPMLETAEIVAERYGISRGVVVDGEFVEAARRPPVRA